MVGYIIHNVGAALHAVLRFLQGWTVFPVAAGNLLTRQASRTQRSKAASGKAPAAFTPLPHLAPGLLDALLLACIVSGGVVWAFASLPDHGLSDESGHWFSMLGIMAGQSGFPEIPVYRLVVAYIMKALSLHSFAAARWVSAILALLALVLCYRIVRKSGEGNASLASLQLFLSPLIFPFFFLLYPEMISLNLVLLALLLTLHRRYWFAAVAAGISVLVREGNIIWLCLCWLLALIDTGFFRPFSTVKKAADLKSLDYREFVEPLEKTYLYFAIGVSLAAYIFFYEGMALGDSGTHSLRTVHITQLYMLLFAIFFLFLPLHLHNVPRILQLLKSQRTLLFLSVLLYAIYIGSFDAGHEYNRDQFFLRNQLIAWLHEGLLNRSLAFIPMLWAFWSLLATPLREKKYYWFYPATVLFLLPIWLVDPRYFIIPLALFMLLRKPLNDQLEYLIAAVYIPLTVLMFMGTASQKLFV